MEAGPLTTAYRSGNADALYKAARVNDSSQRLVAMIPCTEFGFTSTDGLNVARARWVVENLVGWISLERQRSLSVRRTNPNGVVAR